MTTTLPPGPAWLFVPADRPDRWAKADTVADATIVDLENGVAAEDKPAAARQVAEASGEIRRDRLIVRVNPPDSPWYEQDLAAVRATEARWVVMPKVRTADDVIRAHRSLDGRAIIALCETAAGVAAAEGIASEPGCVGLFWGAEDLTSDLGGWDSRDSLGTWHSHLRTYRHQVRLAAAAAGVGAIDSPTLLLDRLDLVRKEAGEAATMGFHAKACVHPDQVEQVRSAFRPGPDQLTWARKIIEKAAVHGTGVHTSVFALDGQMVDTPVIEMAQLIVSRGPQPPSVE